VCRFLTAAFSPKSSHFYSPYAFECDLLKQSAVWQFEGDVFAMQLPDVAGNCDGLLPLFRLFNEGIGGAPNHRYTTRAEVRATMLAQGWTAEGLGLGVVGCVPG
jgi:hypothetical protein